MILHCPLCHQACRPWATMKFLRNHCLPSPLPTKTTLWTKGGSLKGQTALEGRVELTWTEQMMVMWKIHELIRHSSPLLAISRSLLTWRKHLNQKCCLRATGTRSRLHCEFWKSDIVPMLTAVLELPWCSKDDCRGTTLLVKGFFIRPSG